MGLGKLRMLLVSLEVFAICTNMARTSASSLNRLKTVDLPPLLFFFLLYNKEQKQSLCSHVITWNIKKNLPGQEDLRLFIWVALFKLTISFISGGYTKCYYYFALFCGPVELWTWILPSSNAICCISEILYLKLELQTNPDSKATFVSTLLRHSEAINQRYIPHNTLK